MLGMPPGGTSINVPINMPDLRSSSIRDDNNVVVKIKHTGKVLSDRSRPKQEIGSASPVLRPFRRRHPPAAARRRPRRPRRQRHPDPVLRRGHQPAGSVDSDLIHRIGGDDRAWASPGRAGHHAQDHRGVVQGNGRRLGRRESLQARQARLPPASTMPPRSSPGALSWAEFLSSSERSQILKKQMARASVRLANELNAIFKDPHRTTSDIQR